MYRNSMKRIKLLVEGHAEENYFQLLNNNKDIEVKITPTNMKGGGYSNFIKSNLKFKSVAEFKGKKDIYSFLNSNNRSYKIALDKLKVKHNYITNDFKKSKKGIDIIIKDNKIKLNYEALTNKHANVEDLFKLIGLYE